MAYYMGDYYQGDYYQGDPFLGLGAIFGAAKWIGKKIFKRGTTALVKSGGLAGLARRSIPGIAGGVLGGMTLPRMPPPGNAARFINGGAQRTPGIRGTVQRLLPGGASGMECPPGKYMQKKDFVETGKCLRRRMNVTNSRALRKSLRRVSGFGKLASRARRDIGRAATSVGVSRGRSGPVARHHARIRRAA